jgi:hypothetical protein
MPLLKPARATLLNKSHPLTRGLVGCWLFNESTGGRVFDLSGYRNDGTLQADAHFAPGRSGSALSFDGNGDYVNCGTSNILNLYDKFTFVSWIYLKSSTTRNCFYSRVATLWIRNVTGTTRFGIEQAQSPWNHVSLNAADALSLNTWYHVVITHDSNDLTKIYVNSILKKEGILNFLSDTSSTAYIGSYGGYSHWFDGLIDGGMIFNCVLSVAEIMWLHREPFCMFRHETNSAVLFIPIINLTAASSAQSTTSATLKRIRRIKGSSVAVAEVTALLKIIGEVLLAGLIDTSAVTSGILTLSYRGPWLSKMLKIERQWLTDALFNGMTANAFKLGMVISCGWFWVRPNGCTVLYHGTAMEKIDFTNILSVAEQKTESMSLPDFIPQNNNSTYFYVIRRFNNYGCQERTLQAAVKIEIDTEGNLAEPLPNNIFAWRADQVDGNKVQLIWFYSPLEQMSKPVHFKVYYDGGTGQIDYENPIATIGYQGRKFYCWQSEALPGNKYLFTVKAEDINGIENNSLEQLAIDIVGDGSDEIEILKVETL